MRILNAIAISCICHSFLALLILQKSSEMMPLVIIDRVQPPGNTSAEARELVRLAVLPIQSSQQPRARKPRLVSATSPVQTTIIESQNETVLVSADTQNPMQGLESELQRVALRGVPRRLAKYIEQEAVMILTKDDRDAWQVSMAQSSGLKMLDDQIMRKLRSLNLKDKLAQSSQNKLTVRLPTTLF
jgi:hypothetical protein